MVPVARDRAGLSARATWLLSAVIAAVLPGVAVADLLALDDGAAVPPFMLLIGDKGNWAQPATVEGDEAAASSTGVLSVSAEPEGGLRATWNGEGEAQIYLQAGAPRDISALATQDAALVLLMKLNQAPSKAVRLRMGCGYPCQAETDVTRLMQAIPEGSWGTVSFALSCFTGEGFQLEKMDAPLVLVSDGKFSLSLRQVAILKGLGSQATIRCE